MKRGQGVVMAALVVAVVAAGWYLLRPQASIPAPAAGRPAPGITLTEQATGKIIRLPADLAGQPYAVEFFSYT